MQIHISKDGQSSGPYTPAQIVQMFQNGEITSSDSVWIQSTEWEGASVLTGLLGLKSEDATKMAASTSRSAPSGNLLKSTGTLGLSSSQASGQRTRYGISTENEGSENLMRDALGL